MSETEIKELAIPDISMFANTGHHVRFIGLAARDESEAQSVLKRIPGLAKLNAALTQKALSVLASREVKDDLVQWSRIGDAEWARYRFGVGQGQDADGYWSELVGIWVAVDSNVGTSARGHESRTSLSPTEEEKARFLPRPDGNEPARSLTAQPYFAPSVNALGGRKNHVARIKLGDTQLKFNISLAQMESAKPIDVDLIVDLGNSRTMVLALEQSQECALENFGVICKPVPLPQLGAQFDGHDGFEYDQAMNVYDSFVLLHEPRFAGTVTEVAEPEIRETRKKAFLTGKEKIERELHRVVYRIPQLFVEMSPVIVGQSALRGLYDLPEDAPGKLFLSSPKRYAWDTDRLSDARSEPDWFMKLNPWTGGGGHRTVPLCGEVLRFMPQSGRDWPLDAPPPSTPVIQERPPSNPDHPSYPRADALAWMALALLENARRVVTSSEWRAGNRPSSPRRLRRIVVTYPTGWTREEVSLYRSKWEKAAFTFGHTNFENVRLIRDGGDVPRVTMPIDEAVASQLPILLAEIHRLDNVGENWFELVGRAGTARIMTIDIGGGTTDISVVSYRDDHPGVGADIKYELMFKESSTNAGDMLRRQIIERILLPKHLGEREGIDKRRFASLFSNKSSSLGETIRRAKFVRGVLLPIVNRWLANLSKSSDEPFTVADVIDAEARQVLDAMNRAARDEIGVDIVPDDQPFFTPVEDIKKCISMCFGKLLVAAGRLFAHYECDLLVVSGKPSELPQLEQLISESLPVWPERIIFAKGFDAGRLWPLSGDGVVSDAKEVAVVGAALYQALSTGLIKGVRLESTGMPDAGMRQQWGALPSEGQTRFRTIYLDRNADEAAVKLMVGQAIGRKLIDDRELEPEPAYIFRWRDPEVRRRNESADLQVTIRRTRQPTPVGGGEPTGSEGLEIVSVDGFRVTPSAEGKNERVKVTLQDVELKPCSFRNDGEYWLDTGALEAIWPGSED